MHILLCYKEVVKMRKNRGIVWFRQDLRLHDNEALHDALQHSDELIPVYVFDSRVFGGRTMFGFPKTGRFRAQFVIDAVKDLRQSLRNLGSDLVIRYGLPEQEIFALAQQVKTSWVFCNRERTDEEKKVQDDLERQLWTIGQEVRFSRGKMLYYTADLPFPVNHTPDHFATFRKETERIVPVRDPLDVPDALMPLIDGIDAGEIPTIEQLLGENALAPPSGCQITGGEGQAMKRIDLLSAGDEIRVLNPGCGLWGFPNTSPWLAHGCLSPKLLFQKLPEIRKHSTALAAQMLGGLYYRDYLRLMGKKYGNVIFQERGVTKGALDKATKNRELFEVWANGETGLPIIDAGMRQLNQTGYLPIKARFLVAQFLVKELGVSWRLGASYFESLLIDYDACSNWVNWMNIAGVGPETREERKVNYVLQAKRLDPTGEYVKYWIPALKDADHHWVHQPDQAESALLNASSIVLGQTYPRPILSTEKWGSLN